MDTEQAYEMGHRHRQALARFAGGIILPIVKYSVVGYTVKLVLDAVTEVESK